MATAAAHASAAGVVNAMVLQRVYGVRPAVAQAWAPWVVRALALAQCTSRERVACWLAQVGHESGGLRYTREIWGPTAQQLRYEPGTTLARKLGNVAPGDGARYLGRGLIQTTGRANYAMTRERMRAMLAGAEAQAVPDFEAEPEQLEQRPWAALSAAVFWRVKGLNRWADNGDFVELTRRINGGYNGLAHRQALRTRALLVLDSSW